MRCLLLLAIYFSTMLLLAQKTVAQKGVIAGMVKDSADGYALQSVTVTLYQNADSSLLNYKITGEDGVFQFADIPLFTPVKIHFSYAGYQPFSKVITLDRVNKVYHFKNVLLSKSIGELETVVVKAVAPITMNGDTLEINPAAFKLDSNAVVEDMLRRVPGITMWGDGTITVNGKKVSNVYVDGKLFFGNDPTLATQNLPKNTIDKIQVYREPDYSKDNIDENSSDSLLTMNIKLKEDKKFGYFGKTGAGVGTHRRYEADASGLLLNKKLRMGMGASTNNINKSADLQGMFSQGTFRNYNPSNRYVANFGGNGINNILFLGGNMQYDFTQLNNSRFSNQLSASYNYRNNNNTVNTQTDSRNSASNRVFLQTANQNNNTTSNAHNGRVGYNKRDQDKDFSVNANFSASENENSSQNSSQKSVEGPGVVSQNKSTTISRGENNKVGFSVNYRNKDDDDRNLKSFGIQYNLSLGDNQNRRTTQSEFVSFENAGQNQSFNRLYDDNVTSINSGLDINYNALKRLLFGNFSLWGINMVFGNGFSYSKSASRILVSDFDAATQQYISNNLLTNNNTVIQIQDRPSLRISKNFSKRLSGRFNRHINIAASGQGQFLSERNQSNFEYRNITRSYQFFTPSASARYEYQKFDRYTFETALSANQSYAIPSVDQLRPIVDLINQYSINLGNPDLKPSQSNQLDFSFDYRTEKPTSRVDYNFRISAGTGRMFDAIVDSGYFDAEGRRTGYLINMNGVKSYSAELKAGTSLKMKSNNVLQLDYSINWSNNVSPNFVDGVCTVNNINRIANNISVFYTFGEWGTLQVAQNISTNSSLQSGKTLKSLKNTNYSTQGNLNINLFRDFTVSNSFSYIKNSTTGQASALWNAFATCRFLKSKQAEVKLSAMDILKQNQNIETTASVNNVSTTIANGLQQFFIITFSYYPRKFGGGRQGGNRRASGEGRPNLERGGSGRFDSGVPRNRFGGGMRIR